MGTGHAHTKRGHYFPETEVLLKSVRTRLTKEGGPVMPIFGLYIRIIYKRLSRSNYHERSHVLRAIWNYVTQGVSSINYV